MKKLSTAKADNKSKTSKTFEAAQKLINQSNQSANENKESGSNVDNESTSSNADTKNTESSESNANNENTSSNTDSKSTEGKAKDKSTSSNTGNEKPKTVPEKEPIKKEKSKVQATVYFFDDDAVRIEKLNNTFKNMKVGKIANFLLFHMLEKYDDKELKKIVRAEAVKHLL